MATDVRSQIQQLWNAFWAGGIANPLSAIEQISYLLFLKRLENLDNDRIREARRRGIPERSIFQDHESCRWSNIKEQHPDEMLRLVRDEAFPFLKSLDVSRLETGGDAFAAAMQDAVFIIQRPSLLDSAISLIEGLDLEALPYDVQGDIYEMLLSELSLAGKNGQFRTPRHVIEAMVEIGAPRLGEWICDPAAGTAGFIVAAYQSILRQHTSATANEAGARPTGDLLSDEENDLVKGDRFVGYDFDATMVRLGLMNMMLHGIEQPNLRYQDTLSKTFSPPTAFDLVLANPPFTGSINKSEVNTERLSLPTLKTELLFVELCISLLETGGRCAVIVPEGVLFSSTKAHVELRRTLMDQNQVEAVISLPGGVFRPYTGVKTAILVFTRGGSTDNVWFYEVTGDGFSLDDRRLPDSKRDDLKYVAQAFRIMVRGSTETWTSEHAHDISRDRSWTASRVEIAERDFSLAASAYRAVQLDSSQFEDPNFIYGRLMELESQISQRLALVGALLSEDSNG